MVVRDYVLLTLFLKFHNLGQQLWHFCPLSNCPSKQNRAESGAPWSPCTVFPAIITLTVVSTKEITITLTHPLIMIEIVKVLLTVIILITIQEIITSTIALVQVLLLAIISQVGDPLLLPIINVTACCLCCEIVKF